LSLLESPDSGAVIVDGERHVFPRSNPNGAASPWPKLTVVFQQLFLWPHLTLRRNITLPLDKTKEGLDDEKRNAIDQEVEHLLDLFELRDLADRYPNEASLGQRQR